MSEANTCRLKCILPTCTILAAPWLSVNHFTREREKKGTECIQNKLDGCQLTIRRTLSPFYVCEHSMGVNVFTKNMTTASDIACVRINWNKWRIVIKYILALTRRRLSLQNLSSTIQYLSKGEGVSQSCAAATEIWQCLVMMLLKFLRTTLIELIFSTSEGKSLAESAKHFCTQVSVILMTPWTPSQTIPSQVITWTGS